MNLQPFEIDFFAPIFNGGLPNNAVRVPFAEFDNPTIPNPEAGELLKEVSSMICNFIDEITGTRPANMREFSQYCPVDFALLIPGNQSDYAKSPYFSYYFPIFFIGYNGAVRFRAFDDKAEICLIDAGDIPLKNAGGFYD